MNTFNKKYGSWGLVTGASSGIGEEYAKQLAAKKMNIILVARRQDRLETLAKELENKYEIETKVIIADLTTDKGLQAVIDGADELQVGLLINNAGIEDSGHFLTTSIDKAVDTLSLNCKAPLVLTHHFAKDMIKRKRGGIIFMSSLVAFQGTPYIANYAATKAYDLILSESLAAELQHYNLDVLSVNSGFAQTELSQGFDFKGLPIKPISAQKVAAAGLKYLGKKRVVVPGAINKFLYITGKYIQPRKFNTFAFGKVFSHVLRKKL
ncbi:MAG: SDR family oxidoreductase [Thiotrichaceae bacterium]